MGMSGSEGLSSTSAGSEAFDLALDVGAILEVGAGVLLEWWMLRNLMS